MKIKVTFILLFLLLASCASTGKKPNDDNSTGIQLSFTDNVKNLFKGFRKPMRSCYLAAPSNFRGFNNSPKSKNNSQVCTEEELKVVIPYFGTYEGSYSGDVSGTIKVEISDGGLINGVGTMGNKKFKFVGSSNFVPGFREDLLRVSVLTSVSINKPHGIKFSGDIRKDGFLKTSWKDSDARTKKHGTLMLRKTAPYKKRERVAKPEKSKAKKRVTIKRNNTKNTDDTKLLDAAKNGETSKAWKLINKGYDLNAVDESGATALCIAMRHGHHQTAQELLVNGSDKNHKDNNGRTPLHYAAIYNAEIITGVLVQSGVDISAKDKSGKTARDWAIEKKHSGVIRIMDALKK